MQNHTDSTSPGSLTLHSVLAGNHRPSRPGPVSTCLTFGWRAMLKIKHVPEQLFDVTAFPIMFILMFTYIFGGALAGSTGEYLQFLLPGILAQTVVMITMYTGVVLNNDKRKGIFDRFRSLPIWQPSVLVGALLGDAVRYTIASILVITIGLILGFRPGGGATGVITAVMLLLIFSFSLSWIWTALGLVVRSQESLFGISFLIMFPLTFVSNIFVDPQTMPRWLESFVNINPISFLVTAMRNAMNGSLAVTDIVYVLMACFSFILLFFPLTMYLFRRNQ